MSSHRLRPASLATTTKSTGHLAGERVVCAVGDSRDVSAGANLIWEAARVTRISMLGWVRMSADLQGVSSHLGRMSRQRKGES